MQEKFDVMGTTFKEGMYFTPMFTKFYYVVEDVNKYDIFQRALIYYTRMMVTQYAEFAQCVCMLSRWLLEKQRTIDEVLAFFVILDTQKSTYIEKNHLNNGGVYYPNSDFTCIYSSKTHKKTKIDPNTVYDKVPGLVNQIRLEQTLGITRRDDIKGDYL